MRDGFRTPGSAARFPFSFLRYLGLFVSEHQHKAGKFSCPCSTDQGREVLKCGMGFSSLQSKQLSLFFFPSPPSSVIERDKTFLRTKKFPAYLHVFTSCFLSLFPGWQKPPHLQYVLPLRSSLSSLLLCWPLETPQGLLRQILARQKGVFFTEAATEYVCSA